MNRATLATEIIDTCLKMNATGLNQGTSGNVSVRYQSGMLITPSGIPYDKLTVESIVYIDANGSAEAGKIPSSEWHFHLACYQARKELNAVIHTHAIHSTAVSILNRTIPAIHYMVAVTGTDNIPCIPYATFGSNQLAENVANGIVESKALLLQHHGMIAMEINLEKALWLANEVETLAHQYITLLPVANPVPQH